MFAQGERSLRGRLFEGEYTRHPLIKSDFTMHNGTCFFNLIENTNFLKNITLHWKKEVIKKVRK